LLILIIGLGLGLLSLIIIAKVTTPLESTLAPFFQAIGITTKSVDRIFSRIIPVDAMDEAAMGEYFASYYSFETSPQDPDQLYLDSILAELVPFTRKPFPYRVYLIQESSPNAFALPGGIILITKSLLTMLTSDAEVAAIMGHEIGHIELSHCFDAVKFQLLTEKIDQGTLGEFLDFVFQLLLGYSFSKTEEHEADEYAFDLLVLTRFTPSGLGNAFGTFLDYETSYKKNESTADLLRDYFMSHPPMEIRHETYKEKARVWWLLHPGEKREG
jgi:predicted Zn-dependent protease